jgi:hypothetical protein
VSTVAAKKEVPWGDVVRVNNPEHRERLARVEDAMSARLAGARVPRVSVLAAVIERGLEVVEKELGIRRK